MQQQPRRWPGFDKCVKTKLRLDVYIRPWPPGWSFLRRIYTSRGSERVNRTESVNLPKTSPTQALGRADAAEDQNLVSNFENPPPGAGI